MMLLPVSSSNIRAIGEFIGDAITASGKTVAEEFVPKILALACYGAHACPGASRRGIMKERGILMKGAMAQAAHTDKKTNTLRVMALQPNRGEIVAPYCTGAPEHGWSFYRRRGDGCWESRERFRCPYGKVGDRLWIRETWCPVTHGDYIPWPLSRKAPKSWFESSVAYAAEGGWAICDGRWRPSLFMPRWACRTVIEIDRLKVHRVQEIADMECLWEGIRPYSKDGQVVKYGLLDRDGHPGNDDLGWHWKDFEPTPQLAYARLWDSINAKPKPVYEGKKIVSYISYPWENVFEVREHRGKPWTVVGNPWVWGISFKRITEVAS